MFDVKVNEMIPKHKETGSVMKCAIWCQRGLACKTFAVTPVSVAGFVYRMYNANLPVKNEQPEVGGLPWS